MSIQIGVGTSMSKDANIAGADAYKSAIRQSGADKADLVLTFCSNTLDQEKLIHSIRETSGNAPLAGCTTGGEIIDDEIVQNSVSVITITSDIMSFSLGLGTDIHTSAYQAGQALGLEILSKTQRKLNLCLLFSDVLSGDGAIVTKGVSSILGREIPLIGGAAATDPFVPKTYQYRNGDVVNNAVSGVGISGKFVMGVGVGHGWIPIGVPLEVTRSSGTTILEIGNHSAKEIYEELLSEDIKLDTSEKSKKIFADMVGMYPLGIKIDGFNQYLIRAPISYNDEGGIVCSSGIPEGSKIRIMIGSKENTIMGAKTAAEKLMNDFKRAKTKPKFIMMIDCLSRKRLLASNAADEIKQVREVIGHDVLLFGFYAYGEHAPVAGEIHDPNLITPQFYSKAAVLLGIGE